MGYMVAMSKCFGCGRMMSYNPDLVPSVRVSWTDEGPVADPNGVAEPICQACVDRANPRRVAGGLDPIEVLPGAYGPEEVP